LASLNKNSVWEQTAKIVNWIEEKGLETYQLKYFVMFEIDENKEGRSMDKIDVW
jgi:hypothetical protein